MPKTVLLLDVILFICLFFQQFQDSIQGENSVTSVSDLLQSLGYSPFCVSEALSHCGSNSNENSSLHSKIGEIRDDLQEYTKIITEAIDKWSQPRFPSNCAELLKLGDSTSGVYTIYPYSCCSNRPVSVFCDQTTDRGGWTVIQRRVNLDEREDFYRSWVEYSLGFGDVKGEFWLGLDNIHALTSSFLMEMRVDLEDYDDRKGFAEYGKFYVGDAKAKYTLSIGRYSGTAGDGFENHHNGRPFSTYDRGDDLSSKWHCAKQFKAGYWYGACHHNNLNGLPHAGYHESVADGIDWLPWKNSWHYSLKKASMMVRPAFPQH